MAQLTRERVDAEHFVARYAQGRLDPAEQEAFEEFCLMNPEVAEQVGTDRVMIGGIRAIVAAQKPRATRAPVYALAAALALAAVGLALWLRDGGESSGVLHRAGASLPAAAAREVATARRVVRLRDESVLALTVPAGATALPLEIEPAATSGKPALRVRLAEEVAGNWIERGSLDRVEVAPGEAAEVDVTVDLTKLTSAHLRVTLDSGDGRTDDFELRIVRSPKP